MLHETEVIAQFVDAMASNGIHVQPSDIIADGLFHRVHVAGDKKGSRNAWYKLVIDGHPAGMFGDNKRLGYLTKIRWTAKGVVQMTPDERIAMRKKMREAREAKEAADREKEAKAAARAVKIWEAATPAVEHPYLERKGIQAHGARIAPWKSVNADGEFYTVTENALVLQLRDLDKNTWSLQAIFPEQVEIGGVLRDKTYLYGGRKIGVFYTIGKPVANTVLFCEGFATGASLHEATGHAVVVCFDTSNIAPVARIFREKFPDYTLVLCADNDRWTTKPVENPGVHYARAAAAEVNGRVAIPEFSDVGGEPTDFNDLHALDGLAAVKAIIDAVLNDEPSADDTPPWEADDAYEPPAEASQETLPAPAPAAPPEDRGPAVQAYDTGGHFVMLGYDHERYYFFQHEKKQVLVYTKGDFTVSGLIALAPLNWWEMEFPKKGGGVDRDIAMDWLMRGCNRAGIYDPSRLRGRGAWPDAGRVVFHHGSYLSVDGVTTSITHIKSRYVYELSFPLPEPAADELTDSEGQHLLEVAKMFRWSKAGSSALLAGWVALAPLCGALRWRPHIWITGGAGSGKSTVLERYVHPLMNGIEIYAQGNSTEAGIRQTLKSDALPVLFDESESNEEKDALRVQNILALIRQASSESHARTLKGSAGGDAISFHIRSMFCLASIQVAIKQQADVERMTKLSMKAKREDTNFAETWEKIDAALYAIGRDETLPARLFRRALALLPVTLKNIDTFTKAAALKFGSQRDGDQYGTMLAGAWSLTSRELVTPEQAANMIDEYDWSEHLEGADEDEASHALAALLEAHVKLKGGDTLSVWELVRVAVNKSVEGAGNLTSAEADAVLQRYGLRVKDGRLLISNRSEKPKALVHGTKYEADLRGVLLRVPGATRHDNKSERIGGTTSKVISLPMSFVDDEPPPQPVGVAQRRVVFDDDEPPF